MSNWYFFGKLISSDNGESITKLSNNTFINSNGTTYTKLGNQVIGTDGTSITNYGNLNSDGSLRIGNIATGLGAVFFNNND
jgi:hypothetical protein